MAIAIIPRAVKYGFFALVCVILLCCIPVIGHLITDVPGLATFLQGILVLRPISRLLAIATVGKERMSNDVFPGIVSCVGYFIIGLILTWLAILVVSMVADKIKQKRDPVQHMLNQYSQEPAGFQFLAGMFIGPALGVIPLLMYGKHVAIGVQSLMAAIAA